MSASVIIDLIIVLVVVLSVCLGWSRGMVRGILTLVGTILALVVASRLSGLAADIIVEDILRPATHTAIEEHISGMSAEEFLLPPVDEVRRSLEAIENDFIREEAVKLLAALGLSADSADAVARETLLSISHGVVDTVLSGPVQQIVSALICILLFTLFSFLLRPVVWTADQAFRLPLLRQVNQLGGLLFGAARAVILIFVAVWALRLLGLGITEDIVSQSVILEMITEYLDAWGLSPLSVPAA